MPVTFWASLSRSSTSACWPPRSRSAQSGSPKVRMSTRSRSRSTLWPSASTPGLWQAIDQMALFFVHTCPIQHKSLFTRRRMGALWRHVMSFARCIRVQCKYALFSVSVNFIHCKQWLKQYNKMICLFAMDVSAYTVDALVGVVPLFTKPNESVCWRQVPSDCLVNCVATLSSGSWWCDGYWQDVRLAGDARQRNFGHQRSA